MSRFVEISPRAWKDIRGIMKWLESRSARGALSWYRAFWDTATRIVADAESYSLADESSRLDSPVQHALFKTRRRRKYRIIFDFTTTEVLILRVRRPGQRPWRRGDLPR